MKKTTSGDYVYEKTVCKRRIGRNLREEAKNQAIENREVRLMQVRGEALI